jgi:hypothetical protein
VAARVSPTEAIRAEIHELFASDGELLSVLEQVARLSVRLTFQSVVRRSSARSWGGSATSGGPPKARRATATAGSSPAR